MNKEKERKLFVFLDVVGVILTIIGVLVFTIIFKLAVGNIRYLFLVGDVILFVIFSSCLNDLESDIEKPIIKYSKSSIESKYLKKVKLNKKKIFS